MIRSIWLGVIFLLTLVALASFKLTIGAPRPVAAAEMPLPSEDRELENVVADAAPNTAMKGDRLQVTYVSAQPVEIVPQALPEFPAKIPPKIISRHGHEKIAPIALRKATRSKNETLPAERKSLLEANACTSSGLDRIKQFLNPTANCKAD